MDETFFVEVEPQVEHKPDTPEQRARNLIAAIIYLAWNDAVYNNYREAINFFNEKNAPFVIYCEALGYEPSWVVKRLKKAIREKNEKRRRSKNS